MLWHGTRGENIIGILHTGFRIAPADSRRTGAMFGEGVYFSDVFNKSANYAFTGNLHRYNQDVKNKLAKRYVFLCEVALGKMKTLLTAQNVQNLPNMEFQSVMGYGKTGPNPKGNIYLPNGCIVPLGKLQNNPPPLFAEKNESWNLQYNEYIVYNTSQIRIRYIVELRDIDNQSEY